MQNRKHRALIIYTHKHTHRNMRLFIWKEKIMSRHVVSGKHIREVKWEKMSSGGIDEN